MPYMNTCGLISLSFSSSLSTRNCLCKMSQLPPKSLLASPVSEGTSSRVESLDSLPMDSFWLEVENIKQSAEAEQEECSLADVKTQEGRLPKISGVRGER